MLRLEVAELCALSDCPEGKPHAEIPLRNTLYPDLDDLDLEYPTGCYRNTTKQKSI